jgi:2-polyprenyl-6-hydroxyphenyl methylase/3-demethylubiquinone-9 3-methyltransferase
VLGAEYILNIVPKGTHDYDKLITPSELAGFCRSVSLRLEDITGMTYNPITQAYKLSNDVDVNYLVHVRPEQP